MAAWAFAPSPAFAAGESVHVDVSRPNGGGDGVSLDLRLRSDAGGNDTLLGSAAGDNLDYAFDVQITADATPGSGFHFVTVDTGGGESVSPAFAIESAISRPVLERITRNVHATLAGVTGLDARRRRWTGDNPSNGLCTIHLDESKEEGDTVGGPDGILYWRQTYAVMVWLLEQEATGSLAAAASTPAAVPIDDKITAIYVDVCRALLSDRQRGGNAHNTNVTAFAPFNPAELAHPGFALAFDVQYFISASDPTQTV